MTEIHIRSTEVKKSTTEVETEEQIAIWKISEITTEVMIWSTEVLIKVEIRLSKVN